MQIKSKFSIRLQELRKLYRLSVSDFAKELNISKSMISKFENQINLPSTEVLIKMANYFTVTLDYLLGLTTDNDIEKAWTQNLINKRLSLFNQPDGNFTYKYFDNNTEKESIFTYSFGLLPIENTDFKPVFFLIDEKEGDFLELMTDYEKIKEPDHVSDYRFSKIHGGISSSTSLPFLAFINFLNSKFQLGYRLNRENNGLHRVHLITKISSPVPVRPYYCEIKSGDGLPVTLQEVFYSKFLNDQYLLLSCEEKAKFLLQYLNEAFKW